MVAVLLRLRFRVLGNTLQRNTLQLIAVIVGAISTGFLLLATLGGMLIASSAPPEGTQAVVIVGGTALILGWAIVPLLFDGIDRTLDPVKLARFPLRAGELMIAMFLVGVLWVPGLATLVASVGTAIAWSAHPAAAIAAIVTGVVGTATCVVASRLVTSAASTALHGRGGLRVGVAALAIVVVGGPVVGAALGGAPRGGPALLESLGSIVTVLGWSPLGAVWSIPGRIAMGDAGGAILASVITVVTLVALVGLWRLTFRASLRVRGEGPARAIGAGRLGALGWLPSTPTGAIAARSLIYWFRDPRLSKQLILIPVLPALMLLYWKLLPVDGIVIASGPIVASLLPLSVFAGLSFDGTAFAAELAAGVRGLHDRLGRAYALLVIAVPASLLVQVVIAAIIGRLGDLPAMLGLSLGTLLVSVGVVSVSSARIVVPVARAGRNPFSSQAGAATVSIVGSYMVMGATIVLVLPVVVLAVIALTTEAAVFGWLALAVALVLGGAVLYGGAVLGGRMLDASGPALLSRLRLIRA